MKTHRFFLTALLAAAPVFALGATEKPAALSRVEVNYFEPEKFTDFRDSMGGDAKRTTYAEQIRDHLAQQARYYVALGQKLEVTFTDIDMAGDFEPWRGPQFMDVRIVKDLYPPRLVFAFRLVDAEGNVLKQGKRDLRDLSFLNKIPISRDDSLRHEKGLLEDWMRSEFPRLPKGT